MLVLMYVFFEFGLSHVCFYIIYENEIFLLIHSPKIIQINIFLIYDPSIHFLRINSYDPANGLKVFCFSFLNIPIDHNFNSNESVD